MQHLTIMFVVAFFAAADINSAVLMLLNSAWSPRWDITPIVRQDTQKKLGLYLCLRKTSVRKTPLKNKYDYRDKCLIWDGMETSRGQWFLVDIFFQNGRILVYIFWGWILVDTFGDFSWTFFVHENSSPWGNFHWHFLGEF